MMKLVLHQLPKVRGTVRDPYLAPDAALAFMAIEQDTDGLIYKDLYRDPTSSLLVRRLHRKSQLPGYSAHNYGLAVDLDVNAILEEKKIRYEDLLYIMKKRGWICHRRDGSQDQAGSGHFTYLGEEADHHLRVCTMDPTTWQYPAEQIIWERYNKNFKLDTRDVQALLSKMSMYSGTFTGQNDAYTREAILAFQRAWDLTPSGSPDLTLCRVLSYVTAERERDQIPAWASQQP